jgi:hypothetical protein
MKMKSDISGPTLEYEFINSFPILLINAGFL